MPITVHFFAHFKVLWILKWQYVFNQNCISRQFSVKWWDKFKFSLVQLIFTSQSYTEYFDRWIQRMMLITNEKKFEYKKVFGIKTLRVFEPHCEFPGLIYVPDKEYGL
jgi:hypothetical protein